MIVLFAKMKISLNMHLYVRQCHNLPYIRKKTVGKRQPGIKTAGKKTAEKTSKKDGRKNAAEIRQPKKDVQKKMAGKRRFKTSPAGQLEGQITLQRGSAKDV